MLGGIPNLRNLGHNGAGGMGSSIPGLSGILSMNGAGSPMADPGGYTSFGAGGGMDVMGTLDKHNQNAIQFQQNPGSGPAAGGFGGGSPFGGFGG